MTFPRPREAEPETLFVHSPRPPSNPPDAAYAACDENHMDYALIAARLPPELPREWLRSLEESAAFGFAPARGQDALVGQAPKRWLDPVFAKVGKAAVGVNWRKGTITDPRPEPPEREVPAWQRALEEKARAEKAANGGGASARRAANSPRRMYTRPSRSGFGSSHAGAPSVARSVGGAVLACMAPATAKAAGVRNSMAADARFADAVRPPAAPPAGCGDWGVRPDAPRVRLGIREPRATRGGRTSCPSWTSSRTSNGGSRRGGGRGERRGSAKVTTRARSRRRVVPLRRVRDG